jgi:tetratricopeptide (TPR) repeat protein
VRDSFDSGLVPAVAVVEPSGDVGSVRPSMGGQPAWATAAPTLGAVPEEAQQQGSAESVLPPVVRRSNRTLGILLMVGVLVIVVGGIALFAGPGVASFFGGAFSAPPAAAPREDRAGALVDRGRQVMLADRDADLEDAIATFQQALGASADDPRALAALGETMALQAQFRRDEADDLDEKARRLRPAEGTDPEVARAELQARAKVLRDSMTARIAEARDFSERAVRAAPELPAAQRARADALRLAGDLPAARAALAQALARDASSPENRYASAMLALETPETKPQARVDLREAVLSNPRMVRAILRLARLDALEGDVASARAGVLRALEIQPEHTRARALLAAIDASEPPVVPVEISMGQAPVIADGGAAVQTPDAASPTPPPPPDGQTPPPAGGRSPDWFVGEGERLMRNGQAEQARRAFEQALGLQPGRSEALAGLGFVLLSLGDARGAMTQFRRLLDSNPSYAAGYYGMGQAAQRLGQTSVAVQNFRRFLESSSTGPRAEAARRFLESVEGQGERPPEPDGAPPPPPPDPGGTPPPDDGNALPAPRDMGPGATPPSDRPAPESEPPDLPPVNEK